LAVFMSAVTLKGGSSFLFASSKSRGVVGWLLDRLQRSAIQKPRLTLVDRINLAPRQTVALIEADGERLLVASSPEGAPAFHQLRSCASRTSKIPLQGTVS
jgi:flagellar biogenesis protein FliO